MVESSSAAKVKTTTASSNNEEVKQEQEESKAAAPVDIPDFSKLKPNPQALKEQLKEILPKAGLVYSEKALLSEALCKPKLLPLKSETLLKLEKMEQDLAQQQIAGQGIQTSASQSNLKNFWQEDPAFYNEYSFLF